jgi:hypothetical protein
MCYFYENGLNDQVSSLSYNKEYDVLATSNGTRHYPSILDKDFDYPNNNKDLIYENIDDKIDDVLDDPYLPSFLKLWKFNHL